MSAGLTASGSDVRDPDVSMLKVGTVILRWRRPILLLGFLGGLLGGTAGLLSPRLYTSRVVFLPQDSEGSSDLALAASQFGIRVPTAQSGWGPAVYVELLQSPALLEPIARDTFVVAEEGARSIPLKDLLVDEAPSAQMQMDQAVRALRSIVDPREVRELGAVELTVTTEWPSISLALTERLVLGINEFNLETRQSQAAAERRFVEARAADAEVALRAVEERLERFLEGNRSIGSPQLSFERDRLQREVNLRQQIYTSLVQSREEAKIREVRNIPVITMIETPRLPVMREPRGTVKKGIVGGFAGVMLGLLIAFFGHGLRLAREENSRESEEFFRTLDHAAPRFLRGGWSPKRRSRA